MEDNRKAEAEKIKDRIMLKGRNGADTSKESMELAYLCMQEITQNIREWIDSMTEEEKDRINKACEEWDMECARIKEMLLADAPDIPYARLMYFFELIRQDAERILQMDDKKEIHGHIKEYTFFLYAIFCYAVNGEDEIIHDYLESVEEEFTEPWLLGNNDYNDMDMHEVMRMISDGISQVQKIGNSDDIIPKLQALSFHVQEVALYLEDK